VQAALRVGRRSSAAPRFEDEVKAQKNEAEKNITTPTDFTSNGYKFARREFSVVAMIFAIIASTMARCAGRKKRIVCGKCLAAPPRTPRWAPPGGLQRSKAAEARIRELAGRTKRRAQERRGSQAQLGAAMQSHSAYAAARSQSRCQDQSLDRQ